MNGTKIISKITETKISDDSQKSGVSGMKILVVMKRFGSNKDMVLQNFGRQVRLFQPLAKKHKIDFLCPDYVRKESKVVKSNGLRFIVKSVGFFSSIALLKSLDDLIKKERYDVIVASTDPLIGAVCYRFSKKHKIPLIYDLQDNFEAYDSYKLPFVSNFHKKAVKNTDVVLAVSESLKRHISSIRKKPVYVIQNGIDLKLFKISGKNAARKKLKLPLNAKMVVFIGALEKLKGFDTMIKAFSKVRNEFPDAYLLLSGRIDKGVDIKHKNIIFRALPKRKDVVLAINSADVAIIPNPLNDFTKYSFPYKLVEYMACKVPIIATDVGDVSLMLKSYPGSLCRPNDVDDMAEKIISMLENYRRVDYGRELRKLDWKVLSGKLEKILTKYGHNN